MKIPGVSQKTIHRIYGIYEQHRQGIWLGAVAGGLLLLFVGGIGGPGASERKIIFQREAALDFKGAEILGNPRQAILQGQETLFSKTQRSVLESETKLKSDVIALRAEIEKLKTQGIAAPQSSPSPGPTPALAETYGPQPAPWLGPAAPGVVPPSPNTDMTRTSQAAPDRATFNWVGAGSKRQGRPGANMISFPVKSTGKSFLKKPGIILPSGSYVKATLLTGVEAPEGKSYPVLLQLDFAYVIPNDKRLDLSGCFMIAKAQGDLSTERVQMQATKLSCVSKHGGMFEREVNGFIADDQDNSFAIMGSVNSKQDRVAATAFLSSIVSGVSKAIQQAQTTSQTTPLGGNQSVLTGDQGKYIAAGGASEAATMVTQWYLKQAEHLLPTINVGSGQNVWVVMQDQVDLPKEYFNHNGGTKNVSIYSDFTRVLD